MNDNRTSLATDRPCISHQRNSLPGLRVLRWLCSLLWAGSLFPLNALPAGVQAEFTSGQPTINIDHVCKFKVVNHVNEPIEINIDNASGYGAWITVSGASGTFTPQYAFNRSVRKTVSPWGASQPKQTFNVNAYAPTVRYRDAWQTAGKSGTQTLLGPSLTCTVQGAPGGTEWLAYEWPEYLEMHIWPNWTATLVSPFVEANPRQQKEGDKITIPIYSPNGDKVKIRIGENGPEIEVPTTPGLNMIEGVIPPNWDGKVVIDGQVSDTNTPGTGGGAGGNWFENIGPPGGGPNWAFQPTGPNAPKMTEGGPGIPSWWDILPMPKTPGGPQPPVVSGGYQPPSQSGEGGGGSIPGIVVTPTPTTPVRPPTAPTDPDQSTDAGAAGNVDFADPKSPLNALPDSVKNLRATIGAKFGAIQNPVAAGGIPKTMAYTMQFPNLTGGNRTISMDFSKTPFPEIRAGLLIILTWMLTSSFLRKLTV